MERVRKHTAQDCRHSTGVNHRPFFAKKASHTRLSVMRGMINACYADNAYGALLYVWLSLRLSALHQFQLVVTLR
ncbi:Uncharacterised protein [Vibrio cholerae]|nr:Uncharacterised protein [Vibrio cholerae]